MLATSNRIIFLIVVVGLAASWIILSRIRRRARKERYWDAKTPMPDEQFLAALDIGSFAWEYVALFRRP